MPPGRGSISAVLPSHSVCLSASTRNGQIVEKGAEFAHLVGARSVQTPSAVPALAHEARRLEHPEVLRNRRARDLSEMIGDRRRREFVRPHQPQDLPATGLGQRLEGCIHTCDIKRVLA